MSFGDPNNPYGQQQQPQQPGYGYPQGQQPGYGYPQAPPVQQPYGGGYPGGAMEMPGGVKAARVMLLILGGLQALGGVLMMVASAWFANMISDSAGSSGVSSADADAAASIGAGVMIAFGVIVLGFGLWGILTGAKMAKGGNGLRISGIVYGAVITLFSAISLLGANLFAIVSLVLGILVIVFLAKSESSAWFQRPRY
ncbi:hypothetical protein [Streptomyces purpureus]|uniref:Uncharacterized protein n=1 Tax=Streptomyces purpureus TaxID=1951 RepID=A0A918LW77_9ACTN|nr:hypothetical protein [Streptomyces purpureus]GGT58866.1 hypothetical protein GCM10014713_60530 [Streptomyces purpureus]